jgi:hypothetical protein
LQLSTLRKTCPKGICRHRLSHPDSWWLSADS